MGRHKQTSSKSSRKAPKKSAVVEYADCGVCISGLITYPESIDDDVSTDCNCVFKGNFEMFLRKQKDKNNATSMHFQMKNEQRMSFANMTEDIFLYDKGMSEVDEKWIAHDLAIVGRKFFDNPQRPDNKWTDDLLEGFEAAEALIKHLKDLANDSGLLDPGNISAESCKAVKNDLIISARRWVVEQLNVALEEFKEFRDGTPPHKQKLKNDHLNIKNDFLRSKLLHNDFKKYRDSVRQREKNNFSMIDHLRASPELEHTPQVQLALRSLHEFSARLLLADQQLTSQYNILYQQAQTSETVPELHFDLANVEPPDLGSSCINLLYRSILMNQSFLAPLPPSSTSSPLGSSVPASYPRDRTQSSRVTGPVSSAMPSVQRQGTGLGSPSPSIIPPRPVVSFPSDGAAAAGATSLNFKPRAAQIAKLSNKKVERGGGGATINMEDESCSICFEEMHSYDSFYLKSCRHRFHVTCLQQWLKSPRGVSSTCPMCRTYIVLEDEFANLGAARRF